MKTYRVVLKGEFVDQVEANNKEEAKQLAIRMLSMRMGGVGPSYAIYESTAEEIK